MRRGESTPQGNSNRVRGNNATRQARMVKKGMEIRKIDNRERKMKEIIRTAPLKMVAAG